MKTKTLLLITAAAMLGLFIIFPNHESTPPQEQRVSGITSPITQPPSKNSLDDAINAISKEELKKDLYYLASDELKGRMTGEQGNVQAAEFIKKRLIEYELQVEYQPFNAGGRATNNVIGWLEGENTNEIVVVGAHFDHLGMKNGGIYNGADDNASGTVAVIQMAKAFSLLKDELKRTVVFQLYSGEEMGLLGSQYYCNNPTFPRKNPNIKNHIFMLNLDMIGYMDNGQDYANFFRTAHNTNYANTSFDLLQIREELNQKYPFAKAITKTGGGGSDHQSFSNKGVPTLWLFTGTHSNYHRTTDTAEKINYDSMEKITKYGFELLWKITQSDMTPVFNKECCKYLPIKNDHNHPNVPFPTQY